VDRLAIHFLAGAADEAQSSGRRLGASSRVELQSARSDVAPPVGEAQAPSSKGGFRHA
jgi:hypothetical protein